MPQRFDAAQFERELRIAQRRAQQNAQRQLNAYNREVDRVNRENKRRVDDYNRKVASQNQKVIDDYNRNVERTNAHNRRVNARNAVTVAELNRRLRSATAQGPRYTAGEQELAARVQSAVTMLDDRQYRSVQKRPVRYAGVSSAIPHRAERRPRSIRSAWLWPGRIVTENSARFSTRRR